MIQRVFETQQNRLQWREENGRIKAVSKGKPGKEVKERRESEKKKKNAKNE